MISNGAKGREGVYLLFIVSHTTTLYASKVRSTWSTHTVSEVYDCG